MTPTHRCSWLCLFSLLGPPVSAHSQPQSTPDSPGDDLKVSPQGTAERVGVHWVLPSEVSDVDVGICGEMKCHSSSTVGQKVGGSLGGNTSG